MTAQAFGVLTRHFIRGIVEPPILTELGGDAFRRTLIGIGVAFFSFGLFIPRAFNKKYVDLSALPTPDGYMAALPGDTLFMIALPMLLVGVAAVVASPMLFPDETDYRVLTPLPLSRSQLFGAKLAALGVVSAAVVAANAIGSVGFPLFSGGRWAAHTITSRITAHAAATALASAWMVSTVIALQGLAHLIVPARWRQPTAMTLQGSLLLGLLLSLPLLPELAGNTVTARTVTAPPQIFLPPVWFFGVEQWLLDRGSAAEYSRAAALGAGACASTILLVAAAFVMLFRSAESLAGAGDHPRTMLRMRAGEWIERHQLLHGPKRAIVAFAVRGLTRSRLHQFVLVLVAATCLAMLATQAAEVVQGRSSLSTRPRAAVNAVIAAPLRVALCAIIGLRAAFLLPLEREATWVFRLTDDPLTRASALDGVVFVFAAAAIVPAWTVAGLLQPALLGLHTLPSLVLTSLATLSLVEFVTLGWRRLPYTCTYLPGKHHLSYTVGALVLAYAVFVSIGSNLLRWSILHPSRTLFTGGLALTAFAALRRARLREWGAVPPEFEDEDPSTPVVLRLRGPD